MEEAGNHHNINPINHVITQWMMQGEINYFIKVWLSAYVSLSFCYFAAKILPKGLPRLAAFLPIVSLFLLLPLHLHTAHLGGTTAFFLAWLANFKLLMFAFDQGPLSQPSIPLPIFIAVACLPIRLLQQNPTKSSDQQKNDHLSKSVVLNYTIKAILFAMTIKAYDFEEYIDIHPWIIMVILCFHVYLALEIILAIAAAGARALLGAELEPQFDEPYLSSSLQDFWGRRWNLAVTRILRPTVYLPVVKWSSGFVGRKWAPLPAVMTTFLVSGLMHELIFFYLGRVYPTWEITWFFLLHGACLIIELVAKKSLANRRWHLPVIVGTFLTVGFVVATGFWLFFPQLLRCNAVERALAEVAAVGAFVKDVVRAVKFGFGS